MPITEMTTRLSTAETAKATLRNFSWTFFYMQKFTPEAYGAPEGPARAGRAAVDEHGEDLEILADS
jgi:hypothetical protein